MNLGILGGLFSRRAAEQQRIADLLQKVAGLTAQVREMEVLRLEKEAALEEAAGERLRNAAKDESIAAGLRALDRSRARVADLEAEIDDFWRATPYPGNRKTLTPAEQVAALITELNGSEERRIADLNRHGEEKRDLEKFNDAQAARAMSRQTKGHFQAYQSAVKVILDRLDTLGQGNHVTKEDLRKLRELRKDLSDQIQRTI